MTKQIELSDKEFEIIHHALNNLTLSFGDNLLHGWDDGLDLLLDSMPLEDKYTMEEINQAVGSLLRNQFDM